MSYRLPLPLNTTYLALPISLFNNIRQIIVSLALLPCKKSAKQTSVGDSEGKLDSINANRLQGLRQVYETNVFGPFAVTSAFLPLLVQGRPSIVANISSGLGSLARISNHSSNSRPPYLSYGSSKTALNAITGYWAEELKKLGVTIFCIAPASQGLTSTTTPARNPPKNLHVSSRVWSWKAMRAVAAVFLTRMDPSPGRARCQAGMIHIRVPRSN